MDQGSNPQSSSSGESPFDAIRKMRDQQLRESMQNSGQGTPNNMQPNTTSQQPQSQQPHPQQSSHSPHDQTISKNSDQTFDTTKNNDKKQKRMSMIDIISKVQFILFAISLILLPSVILPLPWIWAEYGKGILIIMISILVVTLEAVKVVLTGKLSVVKGFLDLSALLILVSFLLSSILSQDRSMSMWGFDFKLGTGVLTFLAMVVYFYVMRSFMKKRSDLNNILFLFLIGVGLSALLSILSFFGVNLFGAFGSIENLFAPGLSLMSASVIGVVFWGMSVVLGALYILFADQKSNVQVGVVVALSIVNMLAMNLFSVNQGLYAGILVVVTMIIFLVTMYMNRDILNGTRVTLVTIMTVLLAISFVAFRIPAVKDKLNESESSITQISLPVDVTWGIVTRTLSESVKTGVVGFGVDTFSIYYNVYKPASLGEIDITLTNYTYGYNEILTLTGNRGIVGALIWLGVGVMILVQLGRDMSSKETNRERAGFNQLTDVLLLAVFLSSFFVPYGVELYFLLIMLFTVRIMIGAVTGPQDAESFVVKLDILVEKAVQSKNNYLLTGLAVVIVIVGVLLLSLSFTSLGSHVSAMGVENDIIQVQLDIAEADKDRKEGEDSAYPFEKREEALISLINRYDNNVIPKQPENPAYQRRRTTLLNEYITLLSGKLREDVTAYREENGAQSDPTEDEDIAELQEQMNSVIEVAIDSGELTTETGSSIFANWDLRGLLYSNLLGLGLTTYADTGISVVQRSILLNPTCYTCYYRLGEMYVINEDIENAASAIGRTLQINSSYIPALTLGSEIAIANEDYESAKQLLERALEVLEAVGAKESDVFTQIQDRLKDVEDALEGKGSLIERLNPDEVPGTDVELPEDEEIPIDQQTQLEGTDEVNDTPPADAEDAIGGEETTPPAEE